MTQQRYQLQTIDSTAVLNTLFQVIRDQVKEQKQEHPVDVMSTAYTVAEVVYAFLSELEMEAVRPLG